MERRRIGSLEVSVAGLGCNNFGWRVGEKETREVVDAALGAGVTLFDTADMYDKSEEFLGNVLGARRKDIVLTSKFGFEMGEGKSGASADYVKQACEASLKRLKTDVIDLYMVHRPDPATPIAETLGALNQLVKDGKVREIACSNFSAEQLAEADQISKAGGLARFVNIQNEYSMVSCGAEADVLPLCKKLGITFTPYFPLASGLLTGKYRKGKPLPEHSRGKDAWGPAVFTEQNLDLVESLTKFSEARNRTLLELAIGWLLARDTVPSVITGAKSAEQAKKNAASSGWKLTPAEVSEVDQILLQPA